MKTTPLLLMIPLAFLDHRMRRAGARKQNCHAGGSGCCQHRDRGRAAMACDL